MASSEPPLILLTFAQADSIYYTVAPPTLEEVKVEAKDFFQIDSEAIVNIRMELKTSAVVRQVYLSESSWKRATLGVEGANMEEPLQFKVTIRETTEILGKRKKEEDPEEAVAISAKRFSPSSEPRAPSAGPSTPSTPLVSSSLDKSAHIVLRETKADGRKTMVKCNLSMPMSRLFEAYHAATLVPDENVEFRQSHGDKSTVQRSMTVQEAMKGMVETFEFNVYEVAAREDGEVAS